MGKKSKEIKAVLHLPDCESGILRFEKKICDFYTAQVEKKLLSFTKQQKLEVLQSLMDGFST